MNIILTVGNEIVKAESIACSNRQLIPLFAIYFVENLDFLRMPQFALQSGKKMQKRPKQH